MELKINREIRSYTEAVFFGLSMRQFICALLAVAASVGLYFLFKAYLPMRILSWICIGGAVPFALLGFVKYNGMSAEQLAAVWVRTQLLTPKKLVFGNTNLYYALMKPVYDRKVQEVRKRHETSKRQKEAEAAEGGSPAPCAGCDPGSDDL